MTEVVPSIFRKTLHRTAVGHLSILPLIFPRHNHSAVGCLLASDVSQFLTPLLWFPG